MWFTDCISKKKQYVKRQCKTSWCNDLRISFISIIHLIYTEELCKNIRKFIQYHKDDSNNNIANFELFKLKARKAGRTTAPGNTKNVKIAVPLKYFNGI